MSVPAAGKQTIGVCKIVSRPAVTHPAPQGVDVWIAVVAGRCGLQVPGPIRYVPGGPVVSVHGLCAGGA